MPTAICDSEDEELLLEDDPPSQHSTVASAVAFAEDFLTAPADPSSAANHESSLSTGESFLPHRLPAIGNPC
jgi:hypothetical protein